MVQSGVPSGIKRMRHVSGKGTEMLHLRRDRKSVMSTFKSLHQNFPAGLKKTETSGTAITKIRGYTWNKLTYLLNPL